MWKIILLILPIIIISCKETTIDPPDDSNQQHVGITPGCIPERTNNLDHKRLIYVANVTKNGKYSFLRWGDDSQVQFLYNLDSRKLYDLYKLDLTFDGYSIISISNVSNCPYNQSIVALSAILHKDTVDNQGNLSVLKVFRIVFLNVEEMKIEYLHSQQSLFPQQGLYFQWKVWNPFQWMTYSQPDNDYFYLGNNEVLHLQSNTLSKIPNVKGTINAISNDGNYVISNERIDKTIIFYLNNIKFNEIVDKDNYIQTELIRPVFSPDNRFFVQHDYFYLQIDDTLAYKYKGTAKTVVVDVQKSLLEKKVVPNKIFLNSVDFCSAYQSHLATFSNYFNFYVIHTQKWRGTSFRHGNLYEVSTNGKIVRSFDLENTEVE